MGVDGDSIRIYSVRTHRFNGLVVLLMVCQVKSPRLITSHPLPPQALLNSPPSCLFLKTNGSHPARRLTYASYRVEVHSTSHKIVCHEESITKSAGAQTTRITTVKHECDFGSREDPVIYSQPYHGRNKLGGTADPCFLTVTELGNTVLRSADLQTVVAQTIITDAHPGSAPHVDFVETHSSSTARRGLLKSRPDLVAMLDPSVTSNDDVSQDPEVLLVFTSPLDRSQPRSSTLHLISLRHQQSTVGSSAVLHTLERWRFPTVSSKEGDDGSSSYAIDQVSGRVYRAIRGSLQVFEISTTLRLLHEFSLPLPQSAAQMLPVATSVMLLVSQARAYLYDSRYGSVHSVRTLTPGLTQPLSKRKRKRRASMNAAVSSTQVTLLDYYAKLDLAVILVDRDLLAIQVSLPRKKKTLVESRLIDSMGNASVGLSLPLNSGNNFNIKLQEMAATKKAKRFDRMFLELVQSVDISNATKPYHDHGMALAALGCIFARTSSLQGRHSPASRHSSSVKIAFYPPKTMRWVIANGFLSPENIRKGVCRFGLAQDLAPLVVTSHDMVAALSNHDPSLTHLAALVATSQMSLDSWIECLRYLITSFDTPDQQRLLIADVAAEDSSPPTSPRMEPADASEASLTEETSLALRELDLGTALLDHERGHVRAQALRTVIARLSLCYAPSALVTQFRAQLATREITLLIELLRIELSTSGWTSRRLDYHPHLEASVDAADEAIAVIAKLLNVCVDSLGMGAWLSAAAAGSDSGSAESSLATLHTATTSVLEAAQESAFFANFLTDFLRYESAVVAGQTRADAASSSFRSGRRAQPPLPVQAFASRSGLEGSMLPLSAKAVEPVAATRVDAGGELRARSKRDVARKMSRRVGDYEFERLRV